MSVPDWALQLRGALNADRMGRVAAKTDSVLLFFMGAEAKGADREIGIIAYAVC